MLSMRIGLLFLESYSKLSNNYVAYYYFEQLWQSFNWSSQTPTKILRLYIGFISTSALEVSQPGQAGQGLWVADVSPAW